MSQYDSLHCRLCLEELPSFPVQRILNKGLKTITKCCQQRDMMELLNYLKSTERSNTDLFVHTNCCRKFTDSRKRSSTMPLQISPKKLRSSSDAFDWKHYCFLCDSAIVFRHKGRNQGRWKVGAEGAEAPPTFFSAPP